MAAERGAGGPIRWLAGTRGRLATTALLGLALSLALARPLAAYVRVDATSNAMVLLVLLGYAFLVLGTMTAVAVLIGDVAWAGWRERFILGRRQPGDDEVPFQSRVFPLSALIVGLLIAGGVAFEALTGGFLSEYQGSGAKRVTLRGGDEAAKLEVLAELGGERREDKVTPAVELIEVTWRDPAQPERVRLAALAALGELLAYLNDAIDSWRAEGHAGRWQETYALALRRRLQPELRAARQAAAGELRAALTAVVGLLRDVDSEGALIDELHTLRSPESPGWRATVQALIEIRTLRSLGAVGLELDRLERAGAEVGRPALELLAVGTAKLAFAYHFNRPDLDEAQLPEADRALLEQLVTRWSALLAAPDVARRCAAAVVVMRLRDARAIPSLIEAFGAQGAKDARCAAEIADLGLGRSEALDEEKLLRRRLVDALALVGGGDARVAAWVGDTLRAGGLEEEVELMLLDFQRHLTPALR